MTRDELLELKPGRELDALVMQYIFKAEKKDIGDECYWVSEIDGEEECWPRWFSPSTDISASWEVVEMFSYIDIHRYDDFFACAIYPIGNSAVMRARGKTMPEAICKAALLAVMDE